MKIVAPAVTSEEVKTLALAGANEFYCGFVPDDWANQFHTVTSNRRPSGNFRSSAEMQRAIDVAHEHACSVSMVLNAQAYTASQNESLLILVSTFNEMGGDAVIVSDFSLMRLIKQQNPDLAIHVSSVASCRNESAARLCQELGATRLILPRDVTTDEIQQIAIAVPDLEIEAFILNDACIFEEGSCSTIHLPMALGGPICLEDFNISYRFRSSKQQTASIEEKLLENDQEYNKWLWNRFSNGFSTTQQGKPFGPCGLCAIPKLKRGKVSAVKIAGREAPISRKLASVQMVYETLEKTMSGSSDQEVLAFAQNLRPSVSQCQTGYMCYYPEILEEVDPEGLLKKDMIIARSG